MLFDLFEIDQNILNIGVLVLVLLLQLILCFKLENTIIKLIPTLLFLIATTVFFALTLLNESWDALGYLFLCIAAGALFISGCVGWVIYLIINKFR